MSKWVNAYIAFIILSIAFFIFQNSLSALFSITALSISIFILSDSIKNRYTSFVNLLMIFIAIVVSIISLGTV
jgi:hypothetical protein